VTQDPQLALHLLAAQSGAGIGAWTLDLVTGETVWTREMHRLFGTDPTTFRPGPDSITSLVHHDDLPRVRADFAGNQEVSRFRFRIVPPTAPVRWVELWIRVAFDDNGAAVRYSGTAQDVTKDQHTQELLDGARNLLEDAEEMAGCGSWQIDFTGGSCTWSRGLHRIYGTDPETYVPAPMSFLDFLAPEHRAQVQADAEALLTGTENLHETWYSVLRVDGSRRTLAVKNRIERDAGGRPLRLVGVVLDVTETRRLQDEAAEHAAMLEDAQRLANVGSWRYDFPTDTMTCSAQMARILGRPGQTRVPMTQYQQFLRPEDRERVTEAVMSAAAVNGEFELEYPIHRPDGETRDIHARGQVVATQDGATVGLSGTVQDVTELRRAERGLAQRSRELEQANELFQALLGSATDQAILGIDPAGDLTIWNRGAERMLGYAREEVLGRSPWTLLRPAGEPDSASADQEWVTKDGATVLVQVSLTPMRDHHGEPAGYLAIATDVTETRRIEREISRARDEAVAANAAKSAFLATMSHEIRTPMNAVLGMTGLLLDTTVDDEQRDMLRTVRSSGDQLLAIINDVLDFSKIEAGELDLESRPFDVHELVERSLAQFAGTAHGLELVCHVDAACPARVSGDVIRLRQVLTNLIGNAVKFTHAGEVLVTVEPVPPPEGSDGPEGDRVELRFRVRDTGIGIPAQAMDRLFKSFSQVDSSTTRTYGGSGLGLAISKALVTAMGGQIWVESQPGTGSTFGFRVLLDRDGQDAAVAVPAPVSGRRVLLAVPHPTARGVLEQQVRDVGMTPLPAADLPAALALLADPAQPVDVVVVDRGLAGSRAAALAARIHALPGRDVLPLVLLCTVGRRDDGEDRPYSAVLTKPVARDQLVQSLTRAVVNGPAVAAVPAPAGPRTPASGTAPRDLRILLAEDNEVNQKVGRLMLAKLGHSVEIVDNGLEALHAAHAHTYDVILMDMHMPVMDGLEATRRIRAELPADRRPAIVAMTASVTLEDRQACTAAGMDGFVAKPVRPGELAEALARVAGVGGIRP
jgi:PAS domain S-box-containing protein